MNIIIIVLLVLTFIMACITLIITINKKNNNISEKDLKKIRETVIDSINNLSLSVSNLIAKKNSNILEVVSKSNEEINKKMATLIDEQNKSLSEINTKLYNFQLDFINKYNIQKDEIMQKLSNEMQMFNNEVKKTLESSDKSLKEKLEEFKITTNETISILNTTISKNLLEIREDNNKKLEKINESVNEKLQKTLEEKLKDSFKSVIDGIGSVNQAVGEIKGLATDVGSLKNVLTNVKTKGIMGEVILGNIIKDFLTTGQYDENVITKKGSLERVEFAIKLPGNKDNTIYLPVDSKFPYEPYSIINESSNINEINNAKKQLKNNLLKYAKNVSEKYIDVPNTTDFAVIFLPLEGLYLEALNMGLFEEIQSKCKVNLTGPTTFTAFINSLNMGFRSLMIQKKSADVFKLLGAVKTEFNKFAEALDKTQKKVNDAANELDNLVGTRTRMMNSKLKSIEALDDEDYKH